MRKLNEKEFQKLKGKIIGEGYTQEELAKKLGISHFTLLRKLKGRSDFTLSEVKKISKILDIKEEDIFEYF